MTGLPVFVRKSRTSEYMMSDAVTVPPGELMRSTTALTALSLAAVSICWAKRLTLFSVGWRNPPLRAFISSPSTSMIAIFPGDQPLPGWTSDSSSVLELATGVIRKLGTPQPAESKQKMTRNDNDARETARTRSMNTPRVKGTETPPDRSGADLESHGAAGFYPWPIT